MRLSNRYKILSKPNNFVFEFPERINRFKRSKWQFLQKKILKSSLKKVRRETSFTLKAPLHSWEKIQNAYKIGLTFKSAIMTSFDNSITTKLLKKAVFARTNRSTKDLLIQSLIKPYFRLDILLTSLEFFKTPFHARQFINDGNVLLNFKKVKSNVFVEKGDVIVFTSERSDDFLYANSFLKNKIKFTKFYSFVESDLYTKTIVVVKNINELTEEDIFLLLPQSYDINVLRSYL
jgi:ribosomal protein S4